jgi:hypothetical protein
MKRGSSRGIVHVDFAQDALLSPGLADFARRFVDGRWEEDDHELRHVLLIRSSLEEEFER